MMLAATGKGKYKILVSQSGMALNVLVFWQNFGCNMMDKGNSQKIVPGFPFNKDTVRPQGRQEISSFFGSERKPSNKKYTTA